ncbi:MAG: hypothetical protein HC910_06975 [Spirulinaceae cyanobacterium SM2_1_0]|nr:hypothetical protein [Spirulinaceae cyanobacterium SM2_1_0]
MDDGGDSGFGANDKNFDRFAIGFGVGTELEVEFNIGGFSGLRRGEEKGLSWHGDYSQSVINLDDSH